MGHYLLDCCSLINLHCGWGGLNELRGFGESWSVGETVLSEAGYAREFDAEGQLKKVYFVPTALIAEGGLLLLSPEDEAEQASLVEFAQLVDDGEAEALALALHRRLCLVTDDRPAIRAANRADVAVQTVETPELLKVWAGTDEERLRRLPDVVRRITILAKFQPRTDSPHYLWWQTLLA